MPSLRSSLLRTRPLSLLRPPTLVLLPRLTLRTPSSLSLHLPHTHLTPRVHSCVAPGANLIASATLPPTPSDAICNCLATTAFSCLVKPGTSPATIGALTDYACSLYASVGGSCDPIAGNGTTGVYGSISSCDAAEKLEFVATMYYEQQGMNPQACSYVPSPSSTFIVLTITRTGSVETCPSPLGPPRRQQQSTHPSHPASLPTEQPQLSLLPSLAVQPRLVQEQPRRAVQDRPLLLRRVRVVRSCSGWEESWGPFWRLLYSLFRK